MQNFSMLVTQFRQRLYFLSQVVHLCSTLVLQCFYFILMLRPVGLEYRISFLDKRVKLVSSSVKLSILLHQLAFKLCFFSNSLIHFHCMSLLNPFQFFEQSTHLGLMLSSRQVHFQLKLFLDFVSCHLTLGYFSF